MAKGSEESRIRFKLCLCYQKHFSPLQMADEFDTASVAQEGFNFEANDKRGHNICDYLLCAGSARTDSETLPEMVFIPHHKVGSVIFLISLINKTKQKRRLSKFTELVQGHTNST